jgi:hypothetical protein
MAGRPIYLKIRPVCADSRPAFINANEKEHEDEYPIKGRTARFVRVVVLVLVFDIQRKIVCQRTIRFKPADIHPVS